MQLPKFERLYLLTKPPTKSNDIQQKHLPPTSHQRRTNSLMMLNSRLVLQAANLRSGGVAQRLRDAAIVATAQRRPSGGVVQTVPGPCAMPAAYTTPNLRGSSRAPTKLRATAPPIFDRRKPKEFCSTIPPDIHVAYSPNFIISLSKIPMSPYKRHG